MTPILLALILAAAPDLPPFHGPSHSLHNLSGGSCCSGLSGEWRRSSRCVTEDGRDGIVFDGHCLWRDPRRELDVMRLIESGQDVRSDGLWVAGPLQYFTPGYWCAYEGAGS